MQWGFEIKKKLTYVTHSHMWEVKQLQKPLRISVLQIVIATLLDRNCRLIRSIYDVNTPNIKMQVQVQVKVSAETAPENASTCLMSMYLSGQRDWVHFSRLSWKKQPWPILYPIRCKFAPCCINITKRCSLWYIEHA